MSIVREMIVRSWVSGKAGFVSSRSDAVAVSPDGKLLASGSPFYIRMWDLASGERILQDRMGCTALAFSHDGRLLACGGDDGKFKLWDVKRGVEVFSATHPA